MTKSRDVTLPTKFCIITGMVFLVVYGCEMEKAMATHSSVLTWRIPGTAERGGLPSLGSAFFTVQLLHPYMTTGKTIALTAAAAAAAKSPQSCLTLCDPRDGSPPGSSVHGIFQARVLEWGAISLD